MQKLILTGVLLALVSANQGFLQNHERKEMHRKGDHHEPKFDRGFEHDEGRGKKKPPQEDRPGPEHDRSGKHGKRRHHDKDEEMPPVADIFDLMREEIGFLPVEQLARIYQAAMNEYALILEENEEIIIDDFEDDIEIGDEPDVDFVTYGRGLR